MGWEGGREGGILAFFLFKSVLRSWPFGFFGILILVLMFSQEDKSRQLLSTKYLCYSRFFSTKYWIFLRLASFQLLLFLTFEAGKHPHQSVTVQCYSVEHHRICGARRVKYSRQSLCFRRFIS